MHPQLAPLGTAPIPRGHNDAERSTRFRYDVQGLRALAVVLVVAYHLDSRLLPGGFVGVDIFFVISGYLMTRRLADELRRSGRIRLYKFYASRVRRLLPAALAVLLVTLVATFFVAPITLWPQFASQVATSALYAENWALAANAVDYSAAAADSSPVQHFWSLAVEEQFYLIWPVILLLGWRFCRRVRRGPIPVATLGLVGFIVSSFVAGVIWTSSSPDSAYFVTFTRVWELALGGMAWRIGTVRLSSWPLAILGWGGLTTATISAFVFSSTTPYPGIAALVPCLATVAVLVTGPDAGRFSVSSASRNRPLQYLGDISYSLYLWHWPLIIFAPIVLSNQFQAPQKVVVGLLALGVAALSKRFIEDPFRSNRSWGPSTRPDRAVCWRPDLGLRRDRHLRTASIELRNRADQRRAQVHCSCSVAAST